MLRLLFLSIFIFLYYASFSQPSDFISVRKKNGRHLKTFIKGSPILFETAYGSYIQGPITEIKKDSLFIRMFDIRTYTTAFGSRIVDTVRTYTTGIHYKEIKRIQVFRRNNFIWSKMDKLLFIGGSGYFLLNLANGAYLSEPVTSKENLRSLGISLGAVGAGLIIRKYFMINNFSRRKHKIVYVNMTK